MTAEVLLAWLVALPLHLDRHHYPIARPYGAALTIARVAIETDEPEFYAAMLDVLAAHESSYRTNAIGDAGKSCGAYQTPCIRTPKDGLGQTKLALSILRQATENCPGHPIWIYASGHCAASSTAIWYEHELRERLRL